MENGKVERNTKTNLQFTASSFQIFFLAFFWATFCNAFLGRSIHIIGLQTDDGWEQLTFINTI